jgi:hypothetical protein
MRIGIRGAGDQVGEAVAVDVARRGDRPAAPVIRRHAAEIEAVASVEARQVDFRRILRQTLLPVRFGETPLHR